MELIRKNYLLYKLYFDLYNKLFHFFFAFITKEKKRNQSIFLKKAQDSFFFFWVFSTIYFLS